MLDPKGRRRRRDPEQIRIKMLRERECRLPDCGNVASDGHHLLYRSLGGDDHVDNTIPLCHVHHMSLEFDGSEKGVYVRTEIGKTITDDEVVYVINRKGFTRGEAFLVRGYFLDPDVLHARVTGLHDRITFDGF